MPSIVGTPSVVTQSSTATTWSHSHQLNNSGGNTSRRLIINITTQTTATVSSVTFGGETANEVATADRSGLVTAFVYEVPESSLANLTEGNTYTLSVTWSVEGEKGGTAVTLVQNATQDSLTSATGTSGATTISTNITVAESNTLVLDFLAVDGGSSLSADGGQTEEYNSAVEGSEIGSSTKVASSNTSMGWSYATSGGAAHVVVAIPPGSVTGSATLTGSGTVSASAVRYETKEATATLTGQGSISANGQIRIGPGATLTGQSSVSASAQATRTRNATLTGQSSVTGAGQRIVSASANLSSSASLSATEPAVDFSSKFALDDQEADTSAGITQVLLEIDSTSMPTGSFPSGEFFERKILEVPTVERTTTEPLYGVSGISRVNVTLSNQDGQFTGREFQGAYVRLWLVEDGGSIEEFKGQVSGWSIGEVLRLEVVDIDIEALLEDFPRRTIETDTFPNATDLGQPVSVIFGRAVKVPCRYVHFDDGAREYDFVIGEGEGYGGGNFNDVFTVYREDTALDDIEGTAQTGTSTTMTLESADSKPSQWYQYWWVTITGGTGSGQIRYITDYNGSTNKITVDSSWTTTPDGTSTYQLREWRFFDGSQGSPYSGYAFLRFKKRLGTTSSFDRIFADVDGLQSEKNFVRAVQSILTNSTWGLGLTVDTSSFNTAAGLSDVTNLDCEGAVISNTRTIDVVNNLLGFRDSTLTKDDNLQINVDQSKTSSESFGLGDDTGLDNIFAVPELSTLSLSDRVKDLTVQYRRNYKDNGEFLHRITRTSNTKGTDQTIPLQFVYSHNTADRICDYKRNRLKGFGKQISLETGLEGHDINRGDLITVSVPITGLISKEYEVISASRTLAQRYVLNCMEYVSDAYTYSASGSLPTDETFDIQPDFTETAPDPVANLTGSTDFNISSDGSVVSWIDLSWDAPEDNYSLSQVQMKLNAVSTYTQHTTGYESARIYLTPGQQYDFRVISQNADGNLQGAAVNLDNQVAPGDSTAPSAPPTPSLSVKFRTFTAEISSYTKPDDFSHFEWQFTNNGGTPQFENKETSSKVAEWTESTTTTLTRKVRVRAVDYSGNASAWSSFSSLVSTDQIITDDISADAITGRAFATATSVSFGSAGDKVSVTYTKKQSSTRIRIEAGADVENASGSTFNWFLDLERNNVDEVDNFLFDTMGGNSRRTIANVYDDPTSGTGSRTYSLQLDTTNTAFTGHRLNLRVIEYQK